MKIALTAFLLISFSIPFGVEAQVFPGPGGNPASCQSNSDCSPGFFCDAALNECVRQTAPNIPGGPGGDGGGTTAELINPLQVDSLEEFFEAILNFIIRIGTIVVVVMIIIVGFMFVSARGNPEKIKEARTALMWTLVGAVILIGASIIAEAIRATVEAISSGG